MLSSSLSTKIQLLVDCTATMILESAYFFLFLLPFCQPFCRSRAPLPRNACSEGGDLRVTSVPGNLLVDKMNCNFCYHKQDFQQQPTVNFPDAEDLETYSLVMLDPDAPNRTEGQYYLHWIQSNIAGKDFKHGELGNSTVITTYLGPAPPQGTGLHRYMFYVYRHHKPRGRVTYTIDDPERQFFTLSSWLYTLRHQGVVLCGPVSGVQFRSGFSSKSGVLSYF